MNEIFFELIRVALGKQSYLSRVPSECEWGKLYKLAVKQSLVGICFSGLQTLRADEGFLRIGMSEDQYFKWMGNAIMIQSRNETVNRQCVELLTNLSVNGMRSCILKGQGVALFYGEELRMMRQSGDIDVWVDAPQKLVLSWAEKYGTTEAAGYLHVGARVFEETEVELHYRPTYSHSLRYNKRLQIFCDKHKSDWKTMNGFVVPSWEFNVVYLLSHIYRHLFGLGIGLRQLMDYYFVLRSHDVSRTSSRDILCTLEWLGLAKFAGGVMYVMRELFRLEESYLICPVDEKRGRMLLKMVLETGNFGKKDMKQKEARKTLVGNLSYKLNLWINLLRLYPEETLNAPLWKILKLIIKYDKER